jgi:hypothetical protein
LFLSQIPYPDPQDFVDDFTPMLDNDLVAPFTALNLPSGFHPASSNPNTPVVIRVDAQNLNINNPHLVQQVKEEPASKRRQVNKQNMNLTI